MEPLTTTELITRTLFVTGMVALFAVFSIGGVWLSSKLTRAKVRRSKEFPNPVDYAGEASPIEAILEDEGPSTKLATRDNVLARLEESSDRLDALIRELSREIAAQRGSR